MRLGDFDRTKNSARLLATQATAIYLAAAAPRAVSQVSCIQRLIRFAIGEVRYPNNTFSPIVSGTAVAVRLVSTQ